MGRTRNRHRERQLLACLACVLLALSTWQAGATVWQAGHQAQAVWGGASSLQQAAQQLHSAQALLVRRSDGAVLFQRQADSPMYPASLTKIMTALVALETLPDLDTQVCLTPDIFPPLEEASASLAGFSPGEWVTVRDLLYGCLLSSGAECSVALARLSAGTEAAFVQKMNERARQLDMANTHFTNACGLHDPDHVSTAHDLALLLDAALANPTFRQIFTTWHYQASVTPQHPEGLPLSSTLADELPPEALRSGVILGGKTGFTSQAGLCLATLSCLGTDEYILITGSAPGNHATEQYNITDACLLLNALSSVLVSG